MNKAPVRGTRNVPSDVLKLVELSLLAMAKEIWPWLTSKGYAKLGDIREGCLNRGKHKLWFGEDASTVYFTDGDIRADRICWAASYESDWRRGGWVDPELLLEEMRQLVT